MSVKCLIVLYGVDMGISVKARRMISDKPTNAISTGKGLEQFQKLREGKVLRANVIVVHLNML